MLNFKLEPLAVRPFGDIVGRYPLPFLKKVFNYASTYDVEKGSREDGFIFDRRLSAINVWDWQKGLVYTTLYVNWVTGEVTLGKGTLRERENWTPGKAAIFWTKVFSSVESNQSTLLFEKESG